MSEVITITEDEATIDFSQYKPESGASLALSEEVRELRIVGAETLDALLETLVTNNVSPEVWTGIFGTMNDTTDQVRVVLGELVLIGWRVQPGKAVESGKSHKVILSMTEPQKSTYDDPLLKNYEYHDCGASGKRHFHNMDFELPEDANPTTAQVMPINRWIIENDIAENETMYNIERRADGSFHWTGEDDPKDHIPAGTLIAAA